VLPKEDLPFDMSSWFNDIKTKIKVSKKESVVAEIEVVDTLDQIKEDFGMDKEVDQLVSRINNK